MDSTRHAGHPDGPMVDEPRQLGAGTEIHTISRKWRRPAAQRSPPMKTSAGPVADTRQVGGSERPGPRGIETADLLCWKAGRGRHATHQIPSPSPFQARITPGVPACGCQALRVGVGRGIADGAPTGLVPLRRGRDFEARPGSAAMDSQPPTTGTGCATPSSSGITGSPHACGLIAPSLGGPISQRSLSPARLPTSASSHISWFRSPDTPWSLSGGVGGGQSGRLRGTPTRWPVPGQPRVKRVSALSRP